VVVATTKERAGALLGGRYRLEEHLGRGGMADVWWATDELLQRAVAVKILRSRADGGGLDRERFREEARTAARLSHPGIAVVYDFGEADAPPGSAAPLLYLVMELVEGPSVAQLLASGPLGVEHTVDLLVEAGSTSPTTTASSTVTSSRPI